MRPLSSDEAVIEVRDLRVRYHGRDTLHGVFCHFPRNRVSAIMGPSGCGKSTLLKILNRTLELHPGAEVVSGSVMFGGRDLYGPGVDCLEIRKRIGIVQQRPVPFPMSIMENVLFGPRFHREMRGRSERGLAEELLARVGLLDEVKDRLDHSASRLSGGQQQRLCIARCLANQPEVLLMDEPCSAIDPVATQRIEDLIAELKSEYTIIVVTHNIQQARRISDQTVFMFGGRLVEAGSTGRLFRRPSTELARNFIAGTIG